MTRIFRLSLIAYFGLCWLGCASETQPLDPDKLPYKLERVFQEGQFLPIDLDGDGRDERVTFASNSEAWKPANIVLLTHDGQIIDQVNYADQIDSPHFLDLERNGSLEILVPFVRNDSLFLSIVDKDAKKRRPIFLTKGEPRREKEGVIKWDPRIRKFFLADVNGDGTDELITIIATGYARSPRGVLVHSLPDGLPLGHSFIGAIPNLNAIYLDDIDSDGHLEVLMGTGASNNCARAEGLDDKHSYLVAFNLTPEPTLKWSQPMGGLHTDTWLFSGNLDGAGANEFLALKQTIMGKREPAVLQLIDPGTGNVLRKHTLTEPLTGLALVNLDRDGQDEILTLSLTGKLTVLDGKLDPVRQRRLVDKSVIRNGNVIQTLPDGDGDGVDEIIVEIPDGLVFLDAHLRIKALLPLHKVHLGVMRWEGGRPPYYYAVQAGEIHVFRMVKNHFYLLRRFGSWLLWGGFAGSWIILCFLIVKLRRERRKMLRLNEEKEHQLGEVRQLLTQLQEERQRLETLSQKNSDEILDEEVADQTQEDSLARVYTIIGERYSDNTFSIEKLADEMGWTVRSLQRYLKEKIDKKPSELIWAFRLERAKEQMVVQGSAVRVSAVAYDNGFKNPGHFSTSFKNAFGVTPSEYLKNHAPQDL